MADLFAAEPATTQDLLGCARRELNFRKRLYPRFIQQGKLSNAEADLEMGLQSEIVRMLEFMVAEKLSVQAVYGRLRHG